MVASRSDEPRPTGEALLADRYVVGEAIGQGRSTVHRGEDRRLQRQVAIKEVRLAEGQEDAERVRRRAMREAHAAARLNNPHVVTVYDVIEEGGSIWLVMELVDAPSLAQLVNDEGPLEHRRAARIGLAVLHALRTAHEVGVVHRDVKPANVLVVDDDRAKLADFGVATIRDESQVTAIGSIIGSPAYMAPEQAMAAEVGPPADLWALGATLYFAVEGRVPFAGDSALATASAVVNGEPRPQQSRGPLNGLIRRLLAKDPQRRPGAGHVRAVLATAAAAPAAAERPHDSTQVAKAVGGTGTATKRPPTAPASPASPDSSDASSASASPAPAAPVEPAAPTSGKPARVVVPASDDGESSTLAGPARAGSDGPEPAAPAGHPRRSQAVQLAVALLVVVLAVVMAGFGVRALVSNDDDPPPTRQAQDDAAGDTDGQENPPESTPETTEAPTTTSTAAPDGEVPAGWTRYQDPTAGYTIAHPPGWQVEPAGGPRVDIRDPATGSYLRIDWTATPGGDPVADWRAQSSGFASRHQGYQEIQIAPYSYRDYNAGMWEFTYQDGGAQLHVANLGFVTGGRGYALYFQTHEDRWEQSQDIYASFRAAFRPAPAP